MYTLDGVIAWGLCIVCGTGRIVLLSWGLFIMRGTGRD